MKAGREKARQTKAPGSYFNVRIPKDASPEAMDFVNGTKYLSKKVWELIEFHVSSKGNSVSDEHIIKLIDKRVSEILASTGKQENSGLKKQLTELEFD